MTHKPRYSQPEDDDPLSLFAPETPQSAMGPEFPEASSSVEYLDLPAFEAEDTFPIHVGRASLPQNPPLDAPAPAPRLAWWLPRASSSFVTLGITLVFTLVGVTLLSTGWLLVSARKPVDAGAPLARVPLDITTTPSAPAAPLPEPADEGPVGTTERSETPKSTAPNRAAAEPKSAPAGVTLPRPPFDNPLGGRDSVAPAARVVSLPPPSIASPPAAPPSSNAPPTVTTPPAVNAAPPPVAEPEPSIPAPSLASAPSSSPAAAPVERTPPVEAEIARATPPPSPEPSIVRPSRARIQSTLSQYGQALGALSPTAVRAVWPSADMKGLARAFDGIREQTLQLDCQIPPIIGPTAVAKCTGTLRYVPKFGSRTAQVERKEWEFSLREEKESWVIERVVTR